MAREACKGCNRPIREPHAAGCSRPTRAAFEIGKVQTSREAWIATFLDVRDMAEECVDYHPEDGQAAALLRWAEKTLAELRECLYVPEVLPPPMYEGPSLFDELIPTATQLGLGLVA